MSITTLAVRKGAMFVRPLSPRTKSSKNIRKTKLAITNAIRHNAFGISQPFWLVTDELNEAPPEVGTSRLDSIKLPKTAVSICPQGR
jgi:hypothetical protein